MKALILAGGKGTRLRPLTYAIAKQLVPVANKPILHYGLDSLYAGGIRDFGIVISPETGAAIQASVTQWQAECPDTEPPPAVTFIPQDTPAGLAHAVQIARPYLQADPFIMYLGDNLINSDLRTHIDAFLEGGYEASILLKPVENPSAFGVAERDAHDRVIRLVEKPAHPPSNLALIGVYLFTARVFEAIASIRPSARGELEITDAIQAMIDRGWAVHSRVHDGWWLDTGKKDDMLAANQTVLAELPVASTHTDATIDAASTLRGAVQVGRSVRIINSHLEGPISLADDCHIENATILPNTSIGKGSRVVGTTIGDSVILESCRLAHVPAHIDHSLLGHNCDMRFLPEPLATSSPRPRQQFLLADHSEIKGVDIKEVDAPNVG